MRVLVCCLALGCSAPAPPAAPVVHSNGLHFDVAALDRSADACTDFYQYACGGWRQSHPIPPDRSRWSRYAELEQQNLERERALVEQAARGATAPEERRVGAYYAACMDEAGIEARGFAPMHELYAAIDGIANAADATRVLSTLHLRGVSAGFDLEIEPDPRDIHRQVASIDVGILGLDDPDDYTRTGGDDIREAYRAHVERLLRLTGDPDSVADSARVLVLETALARAVPNAADRRDNERQVHVLAPTELAALAPAIDWPHYLALSRVDVHFPSTLAAFDMAVARDLPSVRAYLRYHATDSFSSALPHAVRDEVFAFYGRTLHGTREQAPRWRRCLSLVDRDLSDDAGKMFVAHYFTPTTRARARAMVDRIVGTLRRDLSSLDWLGAPARTAALAKLANMRFTIGYPDRWKSYDGVEIRRDDPIGNAMRARERASRRELGKLEHPTDRDEFFGLAQELDGFGTKSLVSVGFTAGILQPPVFDPAMDDAVNYGGFGGVIGHEITHHFDDEGRKFDVDGNLAPWWSPDDVARYEQRAACFVAEYSRFHGDTGLPLDGKLTLGENLADNGGLRISWDTLQPAGDGPRIDGFTPAQRFFLAWGQIRCENVRPEAERAQIHADPHAPGRWRVNGVVSNMPEFAQAFGCKAGAPMAPADRCRLF